jgi:hypothetical protein
MQKLALACALIVTSGAVFLAPSARAQTPEVQENSATRTVPTQELRQAQQKATEDAQELRLNAQQMRDNAAALKSEAENKRVELREQTTQLRDEAVQLREEAQALRVESMQLRESTSASREAAIARRAENLEKMTVAQREHYEKVMIEREARRAERLQIHSDRLEATDSARMEAAANRLQSRNVSAVISGATFTVDETTNIVTLTTPSGQFHELTHLPDQVITHLLTKNSLAENETPTELEVIATDEGVTYTTTIQKKKRFLGLLSREVPTEVQVDDVTGDISESPIPTGNFMTRILNALSF